MRTWKHFTTMFRKAGQINFMPVFLLIFALAFASCSKENMTPAPAALPGNLNIGSSFATTASTPIPSATNNKVAYFAFDATPTGSPAVKLSLLNFAKEANIVVIFEGSAWELSDTVHYTYPGTLMLSGYYKNYRSIISDIKTLQARGVKVIMNVDDSSTWNTTTPFTTWDGQKQTYQQFAAFVNDCVYTKLQMDGIGLDVEHLGGTAANANYIALLKEFGKYSGPLSSRPTTSIYTAAIYSGAQAGYAIGQSTAVAQYMNFVEDQGYFNDNVTRFQMWAKYIGNGKTMDGLVKDYNSLSNGIAAAQYQPSGAKKAGIMVYAANADSAYSNKIFRALK